MRGSGRNTNRQSIRRCFSYEVCADVATSAGAVFNDNRAQAVFDSLG
jgi:hypothetical protein